MSTTPSSGRRGRRSSSEKATKSNKKVVAAGKQVRYSSKFVQPILEDLCKSILNESAKNTVAKDWTRKLSKSILKKVSEGSNVLFASEGAQNNEDMLQEKINQLEATIEAQFNRLKENPNNRTRITLQEPVPAGKAYTPNPAQVTSIQNKTHQLLDEIGAVRVAVASSLDSLEQNVDIVRGSVDQLIERAQLIKHQATKDVSPTPSVATASTAATQRSQNPEETKPANTVNSDSTQPIETDNASTASAASTRKKNQETVINKQEQQANKQADPLTKMVDHLG